MEQLCSEVVASTDRCAHLHFWAFLPPMKLSLLVNRKTLSLDSLSPTLAHLLLILTLQR